MKTSYIARLALPVFLILNLSETVAYGQTYTPTVTLDWCWIQKETTRLMNAQCRSFNECHQWLVSKANLDASRMKALNYSGTITGIQCYKDYIKFNYTLLDKKSPQVKDAEIDYSTKNPVIRYVKKQLNPYAPERIIIILASTGASAVLGGTTSALTSLGTTAEIGTTKEALGVLEQDGVITSKTAAYGKYLVDLAGLGLSMYSAGPSKTWTSNEVAAYATKNGISVMKVSESAQGFVMTLSKADQKAEVEFRVKKTGAGGGGGGGAR
jgi:hypothetical protein